MLGEEPSENFANILSASLKSKWFCIMPASRTRRRNWTVPITLRFEPCAKLLDASLIAAQVQSSTETNSQSSDLSDRVLMSVCAVKLSNGATGGGGGGM